MSSARLEAIIQSHDDVLDAIQAASMAEEYGTAIEIGHAHKLLAHVCIGCARHFDDAMEPHPIRQCITFRVDRATGQLLHAASSIQVHRESEVAYVAVCADCTPKISAWITR